MLLWNVTICTEFKFPKEKKLWIICLIKIIIHIQLNITK